MISLFRGDHFLVQPHETANRWFDWGAKWSCLTLFPFQLGLFTRSEEQCSHPTQGRNVWSLKQWSVRRRKICDSFGCCLWGHSKFSFAFIGMLQCYVFLVCILNGFPHCFTDILVGLPMVPYLYTFVCSRLPRTVASWLPKSLLIPRDRLRLNSMLSSWCSHTGTLPYVLSDSMAFLLFPPILICSDWGLMSFFFALPKHILMLPQSVADSCFFHDFHRCCHSLLRFLPIGVLWISSV